MADLTPYLADPLISSIDNALIKHSMGEAARDYLGASSIGEECARKLWYRLQGHKETFDAATLRRFQDGHDTEAKIVSWLNMVEGLELHTQSLGKQYGFSDLNGKFKGHYDGVIRGLPQAPKTWHILEIKCAQEGTPSKKGSFRNAEKLKKELDEKSVLREWNEKYYAQAVIYMYYENLDRHITIVATPGGRDLLTFRTEKNTKYAEALHDKASRIINATEPPERIGGADWYQCKWCAFKDMCHG
jgi:hypothetical protein